MIDDVKLWRPGSFVVAIVTDFDPIKRSQIVAVILESDAVIYQTMNKSKITVAKQDRDAYNKSRSSPNPKRTDL